MEHDSRTFQIKKNWVVGVLFNYILNFNSISENKKENLVKHKTEKKNKSCKLLILLIFIHYPVCMYWVCTFYKNFV